MKSAVKNKEVEVLRQISSTINSTLRLDEVLKRIVKLVVEVAKADACLIYLLDGEKKNLFLSASKIPHPEMIGEVSLKVGEGITGWVAKKGEPVIIGKEASSDKRFKFVPELPEDKYEAFLSYPVFSQKKLVGVINVQYKKPRKFNDVILSLLETISHQVGGAIINARLYEEAARKAQIIETFQKVSQTIVSKRYLEEILSLIVLMAAKLLNARICSILLLDEKKGELLLKATQSTSPEYCYKPPVKLESSVSGKVVREKAPLMVKDLLKDKEFSFPEIARKEGLFSLLSVPMMSKGKAIGTVNIYSKEEKEFTSEEIDIIQAFANQAAIAIENTRLLEEATEAKEALLTKKLVDRAKAVLIKKLSLSEEEAHKLIYRKSMDLRKPVREVAEAIVLASEIE